MKTLRSYTFIVALAVVITGLGLISAGFGTPARSLPSHPYRDTGAAIAVSEAPSIDTLARPRASLHLYHSAIVTVTAAPTSYRVRPGDTLESISAREYHNANAWPELWWINRSYIPNPNSIRIGQVLKLSAWHPVLTWVLREAMKAIPKPPVIHTVSYSRSAPVSYHYSGNVNPAYYSGFERCVIARESGGQVHVMNATGHYGLYQFSASTWKAYGGSPADFGIAGAAEQRQVFLNAMARNGESNWSAYDGC